MLTGKNKWKMGKKALCLVFAFLLSIESMAAIVSDNDGSAFITKAEYDSLKNSFQAQIDGYNTSIDAKIDNAISSYLAGVKIAKSGDRASLREGIIWSIGPFDRPRFKHGTPIWDLMTGRTIFPDTVSSNRLENRSTYIMMRSSWGDRFTNKDAVVNERWGYDDIFLKNVGTNGALLDGWYGLCGHWKQIWYVTNLIAQWSDPVTDLSATAVIAVASPQNHASNECWGGNYRPMSVNTGDASWPVVEWVGNPFSNTNNTNGNINYGSITKGNQLKWDNNISAFAPITYNCFSTEYQNVPEDWSGNFLSANKFRDEKCYVELAPDHYTPIDRHRATKEFNLLRWTLPDPDLDPTPANNPWNTTSMPGYASTFTYAYHYFVSSEDKLLLNSSMPLYATRGYISRYVDSGDITQDTFSQYMYIQEPRLETRITNWNKIGLTMPIIVDRYVESNAMTSQLLTLGDGKKAMSLAAGVPTAQIEKKQKITIKGEFRKDCNYTYNASTKTSTLNEGTKDTTDAYVVYAKYSPFNINAMPEDESELIDISPTTKDTDNKGKLTKCRIVRDGNINITFENDTDTEKVVFLKWEKLSNWNAARTARRTGTATNTDVHKINTTTSETIAAPTWTYFGGGFAKFEDTFKWENIED